MIYKLVGLLLIVVIFFGGGYFLIQNLSGFMAGRKLPSLPFTTQIKSTNLGIKLTDYKKSEIISAKGGSLSLEGDQGKRINLDFPKMSILGTSDITVTQIQNIDGLPAGATLINGVQINSLEDKLGKLATLDVELPEEVSGKRLLGFVYDQDGKNFRRFPVEIKDGKAIFSLDHFSGYGVISVDDSYKDPPTKLQVREEAQLKVRELLKGNEGLTEELKSQILSIMQDWYQRAVKPGLEKAKQNDELVIDAVHEFVVWWQGAQSLGMDKDTLKNESEEGKRLSAEAIKNASEKAYQKCTKEKDPAQAGKLMKLYALAHLLGTEGISGLNVEDIKNKVIKCANFEVKFTSQMVHHTVVGTIDRYSVSGMIPLTMNEDFSLAGEGEIKGEGFTLNGKPCTQSRPEVYLVKVLQTKFTTAEEKPGISLLYDMGEELSDIRANCFEPGVSVEMGGTMWDGDFAFIHEGERVQDNIIKFSNWEILGKGEVYAKKTYKQTKTLGVPIDENTTLELIHKPK